MTTARTAPRVIWNDVNPADILSGLRTLGSLSPSGRLIAYRGEPVDKLLICAGQELALAEHAPVADDDQRRHASQAVGHAKKAVDCLLDAYLERDFLSVHLRPRAGFIAKLKMV